MGGAGQHPGGTSFTQQLGPLVEGAAGIDHVVDQHRRFAGHIANHGEAFGHIVGRAALVNDGEGGIAQLLGEGPGPGHPAHIRRHHHQFTQVAGVEIIHQHRGSVDVVAGNVEVTLDLGRVQVHGQHAIHPRFGQQVGHQFGGNRFAPSGLAVGPGVAVVGHHRGDLARRGAFAGIHHDQQLHQVIVHRSTGGLDQEDIAASDRFLDLDIQLAIGKALDHPGAIGHAQVGANFLGQLLVGRATKQPQSPGVVVGLGLLALVGEPISSQETGHDGRGGVGLNPMVEACRPPHQKQR